MRKVGLALLAVLVGSVLFPVSAQAARTVIFRGGGWGHGIGMSQYGAYGRALNGASARQILRHYYTGVTIQRRRMPGVRVGLLQGQTIIRVKSVGGDIVFKVAGARGRIVRAGPRARFRLEPSPTGGIRIYRNGKRVSRRGRNVFGTPDRPVVAIYERFGSKVHVFDKSTSYAYGRLKFGTYGGCSAYCLRLVLPVGMQKYLYGLGEVPSSWPQATLRAQAIAGRTYAFKKARDSGHHRGVCDCTVYDSTLDQAYIGDRKRSESGSYWDDWKRAVDATNRNVILHRGAPILALYSSSSGGHTENNENVWAGTPIPYLRGVPDRPDAVSANPNHRWRVRMSWARLSSMLDSAYNTGRLRRFRLVRPFGVSGRVTLAKPGGRGGVRIVGRRRTVRVDGYHVRSVLGLRDTLFRVRVVSDTRETTTTASGPLEGSRAALEDAAAARSGVEDLTSPRSGVEDATSARSDVEDPPSPLPSVDGRFAEAYRRVGGGDGPLGAPLRDDVAAPTLPDGGRRQRFEGGTLYAVAPRGDVFALLGGDRPLVSQPRRGDRVLRLPHLGCGRATGWDPAGDLRGRCDHPARHRWAPRRLRLIPGPAVPRFGTGY